MLKSGNTRPAVFFNRLLCGFLSLVLICAITPFPAASAAVSEAAQTTTVLPAPLRFQIEHYSDDAAVPPPPGTSSPETELPGTIRQVSHALRRYAVENGLDPRSYIAALVSLYARNPDAREFCLAYPWLWNKASTADMSAYENTEGVPLFLQWDLQWGYFDYGGNLMGLSGCGPTTLAMAAYYFTGDPAMNPLALAQFALDNGYRYPGNGTAWSFMSDGARQLGLQSRTLPLDKAAMIQALEDGALIICIMGPGQFTTGGHYILLTGYENGSFTINDCNSISRSQRTWTYEEICGEILNLWAISG